MTLHYECKQRYLQSQLPLTTGQDDVDIPLFHVSFSLCCVEIDSRLKLHGWQPHDIAL